MNVTKSPSTQVCTTQEAAEILSISVTSVQHLVEAGTIHAWKTKGGHRRIPLAAIHEYKKSLTTGLKESIKNTSVKDNISILIIEDNAMQREIYAQTIASWNLPAELTFCENGYLGLIEIARNTPDVLLTDIKMEGIDGYEIINTIIGLPDMNNVNIAILSGIGIDEIEERGGMPNRVVYFSKPINYDELRGYLRACCSNKLQLINV
jgi:excisionase family DNA binding protein